MRMAVITDLHAGIYGDGQDELLGALQKEDPDVILLVGDIADDEVPDVGGAYPCFYVSGNHEFWSGRAEALKQKIEEYGVEFLEGEGRTLEINGTKFQIFGVDDPDCFGGGARLTDGSSPEWQEQLAACEAARRDGIYSVLMSHRPELVMIEITPA